MKTILLILISLFPVKRECLQLDIILIGDLSASVRGHEDFIQIAFHTFAKQFELSEETVKIGLIEFGSDSYLKCHLTSDSELLHSSIADMNYASGTTNMISAFQMALDEMVLNGRHGYKKIIILVSDGEPDSPDQTRLIARQLQIGGVNIYGIAINSARIDENFMSEVSYQYLRSDFESLSNEIKKLDVCM